MTLSPYDKPKGYPYISGEPSTDRAIWSLACIIWEQARKAVAKEDDLKRREQSRVVTPSIDPEEMKKLLLKPAEVAKMISVSRNVMYEMLHTGEIPSLRIGKSIRVPKKALLEWIDAHQVNGLSVIQQ